MYRAAIITTVLTALLMSCTADRETAVLSGTITNHQASEISLELERLHYKFSDPLIVTEPVRENGSFRFEISLTEPGNFILRYNNTDFPVFLMPGEHTQLVFNHAHFPGSIRVSGFGRQHYESLLLFYEEAEALDRHKNRELHKFMRNQPNEYLNTHRNKISRAKEFLGDTPFNYLIHKYTGEYLVGRIREIRLRKDEPGFNVELARLSVIREARIQRFFNYESLLAQRAGIRDFSHEWVQTFETPAKTSPNLTAANGGATQSSDDVRDNRWKLLQYVTEPQARRHAIMYLIAEEMGDYDFEAGVQLLNAFTSELSEEPAYLTFLNNLKDEIGKTQPGSQAVPFRLETTDGQIVTLDDMQGRYVLLDFWASWCQPCIQEIPSLTEIYDDFDSTDFEIISISLDENKAAWQAILTNFDKPWIHSYDGTGFKQETFRSYRAGGIPFYVLIGRDGTILRNNDFRPSENLRDILEELVLEDLDHTYAGQR